MGIAGVNPICSPPLIIEPTPSMNQLNKIPPPRPKQSSKYFFFLSHVQSGQSKITKGQIINKSGIIKITANK